MTATSGRKCFGQFGRYSPLGSLARTLMESEAWYSPARRLKWQAEECYSERITLYEQESGLPLEKSAEVLSVRDIPSRRLLFRLVPSVRPTGATGCGLLPTPVSIDAGSGRTNRSPSPNAIPRPTLARAAKIGLLPTPMTSEISHAKRVRELKAAGATNFHSRANGESRPNGLMDFLDFHNLLPTPNAAEGTKYTRKLNPNSQMGRSLTALAVNGLLLTPQDSDGKRSGMSMETLVKTKENGNLAQQVAHRIGGGNFQLNPLFVEEMMGFPRGWTLSPFLNG